MSSSDHVFERVPGLALLEEGGGGAAHGLDDGSGALGRLTVSSAAYAGNDVIYRHKNER